MLEEIQTNDHHILQLATYAGKIVLINGGEIYRVEDIISRIGKHFDLKIDSFATMTCIIVSGKNKNGEIISLIERINFRVTNLNKINQVHEVINNIKYYNYYELKLKLEAIDRITPYKNIIKILSSAFGASCFVVLFKGNFGDFITAFISGVSIALFSCFVAKLQLNSFFINLISSAIGVFISELFYTIGIIENSSISIISTLMLLVPGVAFINSIRDIIAGDLVAGTSRITEIFMIGAAIAIGAGLVTKLFYYFGGF